MCACTSTTLDSIQHAFMAFPNTKEQAIINIKANLFVILPRTCVVTAFVHGGHANYLARVASFSTYVDVP